MKWYLKVLNQYTDFDGRARRKEYWMFVLFNMLFAFAAAVVGGLIAAMTGVEEIAVIFYALYGLAVLIPGIAVMIRRLHDTGKSGWWCLISFVPLIGGIWLLILLATDSQPGSNQYGANPKTGDSEMIGAEDILDSNI